MEQSDKTGFDRCMGELAEPDEVAGELFRGLSDETKQNKEKRAKEEAAVEVVGNQPLPRTRRRTARTRCVLVQVWLACRTMWRMS